MHYASFNQPLSIASLINKISLLVSDEDIFNEVVKIGYEDILFDTLVDQVSMILAKKINVPLGLSSDNPYWSELALLTLVGNVISKFHTIIEEKKINQKTFEVYNLVSVRDINGKKKPKLGWRTKQPNKDNTNKHTISIKGQRFKNIKVSKLIENYQDNVSNNTRVKVRETIGGFKTSTLLDVVAYLTFAKDYKKQKYESKIEYKERLNNDAKTTKALIGEDVYYTTFFDTRGRDYASFEFGFLKPYGNAFESRLLEQEEYKLSNKGSKRAKWYLYCNLNGKVAFSTGVKGFRKTEMINLRTKLIKEVEDQIILAEDYDLGFEVDTRNLWTPKQLGNKLYLIDLIDLSLMKVGTLTTIPLEMDMVNSGLIHFANMFRISNDLLKVANLKGNKRIDSHTVNLEIIKEISGKEYTRDQIKEYISQPLFHGARLDSIAKNMRIDKDTLHDALEASFEGYGLINQMAEFGKNIHLKNNPVISWTMPDGFVASSVAYSKNNDLIIRVDGVKRHINVSMPLLSINDFPFKSRDKSLNADGTIGDKGTINKAYGLWANITHSFDAFMLRQIKRWFISELGYSPLTILDDFKVKANDVDKLYDFVYQALDDIYNSKLIYKIMSQLENKYGVKAPKLPEFTGLEISRNNNIVSA